VELNHVRVLRSQWKPRRNFDSLKTFCPLRFSLENKQGNTQNTRHAQEKGREREREEDKTHIQLKSIRLTSSIKQENGERLRTARTRTEGVK